MNKPSFGGFNIPNTTPVPDIVFDELLSELTGNELKVLLYVIRRTYGFGKNADAISLSQFRKGITTQDKKVLDKGCGIEHNRTILAALTSLEKKGYVIARKRHTKAGDADTTVYKLRLEMASSVLSSNEVVTSGNDVVTQGNKGSYSTSPRWLPQVTTVVTPGNPQETVIQLNSLQETVIQDISASNSATLPFGADAPTPPDDFSEIDDPEKTLPRIPTIPASQEAAAQTPSPQTEQAAGVTAELSTIGTSYPQKAHVQKEDQNRGVTSLKPLVESVENEDQKPHSQPLEPLPTAKWGTRKCLQWFDYWRGGILIGKYNLMKASTCAKGLAEQFTEAQVIAARDDMLSDSYWIARGFVDVCDVANNIHRYANKKKQPAPGKPANDVPRSAANMPAKLSQEPLVYPMRTKQVATAGGR